MCSFFGFVLRSLSTKRSLNRLTEQFVRFKNATRELCEHDFAIIYISLSFSAFPFLFYCIYVVLSIRFNSRNSELGTSKLIYCCCCCFVLKYINLSTLKLCIPQLFIQCTEFCFGWFIMPGGAFDCTMSLGYSCNSNIIRMVKQINRSKKFSYKLAGLVWSNKKFVRPKYLVYFLFIECKQLFFVYAD